MVIADKRDLATVQVYGQAADTINARGFEVSH